MTPESEHRTRRGRRFWICSVLLLAQLLTVAPIVLIILAGQKQTPLLQRDVYLLQELDRLSVQFKDAGDMIQASLTRPWSTLSWEVHQSQYRDELASDMRYTHDMPVAHEILGKIEAIANRMSDRARAIGAATSPSREADLLMGQLLEEDQAVLGEVLGAQRLVRLHLSILAANLSARTNVVKILLAASCLLAFGLVFVFRGFRIETATQRRLEQSLRGSNEEVIAALAALREGADAKNDALIYVGDALRSPLDGMIHLATKLLETNLSDDQRDCAQASLHSALTLAQVIRDIQDLAMMESGRLDLAIQEFRPARVLEDTVEDFRIAAKRKELKIESVVAARLGAPLRGDERRLRQVLTNLLDNAVKFSERGSILLNASEVSRRDGRTTLRFEIKDPGIGIDEQIRDRLFEPLPQSSRKAVAGRGAGLGLAIAKRLVHMMSGEIGVAACDSGSRGSQASAGSTFWFTAVFEQVAAAYEVPREDALAIAVTNREHLLAPHPKRAESRHCVNYPTLLRSKVLGVALVRVLDVSGFGLRVTAPFRLPVGTEVEIRIEELSVRGLVRNCACVSGAEFHAGIELLRSDAIDERGLAEFVSRRMARPLAGSAAG